MRLPRADIDVILPDGIDDPERPSGGNTYDRRICDGLRAAGWRVREVAVGRGWPDATAEDRRRLAAALTDGRTPVLIDGLIGSAAGDALADATVLRPVLLLVHMLLSTYEPLWREPERRAMRAAAAVIATSEFTAACVQREYGVRADRVHVAAPGADAAAVATRTTGGTRMLQVGPVTTAKGTDVLMDALLMLAQAHPDLSQWTCTCAGRLDVDTAFAARQEARVAQAGLSERILFTGPKGPEQMAATYAQTDVLLVPSRAETWGLVITEALARAIPVIAADVGGTPEAMGRRHAAGGGDGRDVDERAEAAGHARLPGALIAAGDARGLAQTIARWLDDSTLRASWRDNAVAARRAQPAWDRTVARIATAVRSVQPPARTEAPA